MRAVAGHGLPPSLERTARAGVPLLEAGTALLLLAGFHRAGAVLAVVLLTAFTVVVIRAARRTGVEVPCGCFGKRTRIDARLAVSRNVALAVLAIAAFGAPPPGALPTDGAVLPLAMALVGVAAGAWFVATATGAMRPRPRTGSHR
jgi:hypothetical protein